MVAAAREVIALVDHTKWERAAFATFCPTDQISHRSSPTSRHRTAWSGTWRAGHRGAGSSARTARSDRGGRRTRLRRPQARLRMTAPSPADRRNAAPRVALARDLQAVRATQALDDVSLDLCPARSMRSSARTAPARARSSRSSPASTSRTAGTIRLDGEVTQIHGPAQARALGIAVVHQEPRLFPDLTVAENVFIGHAPSGRLGTIDWGADAPGGRGAVRARRPVRRRRAGPRPLDGRPAAHRDRQVALGSRRASSSSTSRPRRSRPTRSSACSPSSGDCATAACRSCS
jgi:hypothetical protein